MALPPSSRSLHARRAGARDFPRDRRIVPDDRRAGRLAHAVAARRHGALAGLDPQHHGRPGRPRSARSAARHGGAAPDADRACASSSTACCSSATCRRTRSARSTRASRSAGSNPQDVMGAASELLSGLGRRRRAGGDAGARCAGAARRDRRHRAGPSAARARVRGQPGREPHHQHAAGLAAGRAGRSGELSQRALQGPNAGEARAAASEALARDRAALDQAAAKLVENGLVEWSGEDPTLGRSLIVRGRGNLLAGPAGRSPISNGRGGCSTTWKRPAN